MTPIYELLFSKKTVKKGKRKRNHKIKVTSREDEYIPQHEKA